MRQAVWNKSQFWYSYEEVSEYMKLTKQDKKDLQIIRAYIKVIEKGFGRGHVKKHAFDFDTSCAECASRVAVAYARNVIDLYS